MSVPNGLDTFTSGMASVFRLPKGITAISLNEGLIAQSNVRLLKLYDIENSRACRTVRERITELDLVVEKVIPATENSRALLDKDYHDCLPSGHQVPCLMIQSSTGSETILSGEAAILEFLEESFVASAMDTQSDQPLVKAWQQIGYYMAGIWRTGRGCRVSPCVTASSTRVRRPKQPLLLYSYEGNQFCRLVREVLTELDIVYELRSAGKGSTRRMELAALTNGSTQCPYLVDPNTGQSMPESTDIIAYLYKEYALWTPPSELLEWISEHVMSRLKPIFTELLVPWQAGSARLEETEFQTKIEEALSEIVAETNDTDEAVVLYTYSLSPFSYETKKVLDRLQIPYKEISLGKEWLPGLLGPGGAEKRAALMQLTGQSSLPHIFVGGKSIGGLFSGTPGLIPALSTDKVLGLVQEASTSREIA